MPRHASICALLSLASLLSSCGSESAPHPSLEEGSLRLRYDLGRGTFDLRKSDGSAILLGAFAEAQILRDGLSEVYRTSDAYTRSAVEIEETDALGDARRLVIEHVDLEGAPDL
ncbi:MAG: hypothetical protein OEY14_05515, partial [Myxococcales bacterium]|nr:hypothetical protein [Myxococcales bacterium]